MPYIPSSKFRSAYISDEDYAKITRLTFNEARRIRGPLYETLVTELLEQGCTVTATTFQWLVAREEELIKALYISERVVDNRELLLQIFESVKDAEKFYKSEQLGGIPACLRVLNETLIILSKHVKVYDWLQQVLFKIFLKIAVPHVQDMRCTQTVAKMYVSYAIYFSTKDHCVQECMKYFGKSLTLCRSENWVATHVFQPNETQGLHDFAYSKLAQALVRYANLFVSTEPELAIKLAHKAIVSLSEVNTQDMHHNTRVCELFLEKINLLIETENFEEAMTNILFVETHFKDEVVDTSPDIICKMAIQNGLTLQRLGRFNEAIIKYKEALLLSEKFGLAHLEGEVLLHIAKVYIRGKHSWEKARACLKKAEAIFGQLGDEYFRMRAKFALANVSYRDHFTEYMGIIKTDDDTCSFQRLKIWKNRAIPFWSVEDFHLMKSINERKKTISDSDVSSEDLDHVSESHEQLLGRHSSKMEVGLQPVSGKYRPNKIYCLSDEVVGPELDDRFGSRSYIHIWDEKPHITKIVKKAFAKKPIYASALIEKKLLQIRKDLKSNLYKKTKF